MNTHTPYLDGEQLLEDLDTLGEIGKNPAGGIDRIAFSAADMEGRRFVEKLMQAAGMTTRTDAAGNTIGLYAGMEDLPPIGVGSHTDTVPRGGKFDGALGVLAAIAAVRALNESNMRLRRPIEVVNFTAEEATMAGGTMGSRFWVKEVDSAEFDQPAWDNQPTRSHLLSAGIDPEKIGRARRDKGSLAAFLELHIEQGETLEQREKQIGVVEGIVGIRRYQATFTGYANHAGTTGMERRQDALVAAAPFVPFVRETAIANRIVGTIGKVDVHPGAPNVIPGQVDLNVEIRGLDEAVLDHAAEQLRAKAEAVGGTITQLSAKPAVRCNAQLTTALCAACEALDMDYLRMPSGAGHDAMNIAFICPIAMLFVPSQGGVSHAPDEYTRPEDCINGARVLLEALLRFDEVL